MSNVFVQQYLTKSHVTWSIERFAIEPYMLHIVYYPLNRWVILNLACRSTTVHIPNGVYFSPNNHLNITHSLRSTSLQPIYSQFLLFTVRALESCSQYWSWNTKFHKENTLLVKWFTVVNPIISINFYREKKHVQSIENGQLHHGEVHFR